LAEYKIVRANRQYDMREMSRARIPEYVVMGLSKLLLIYKLVTKSQKVHPNSSQQKIFLKWVNRKKLKIAWGFWKKSAYVVVF
jgi:hypothetical protein